MIYSALNDVPIEKHDFKSLRLAFVDIAFNKFMDDGRVAFKQVAADIFDNAEIMFRANFEDLAKAPPISEHVRSISVKDITRLLMDHFIEAGSKGLATAVYMGLNRVAHELSNTRT